MEILLTIGIVGAALFAWVCLFKAIPSALLSMFRYRLWRQRDELAEEIRNDTFEHKEEAQAVLNRIECFIRVAPELSPLHILLMRLSTAGVAPPEDPPRIDFTALSPGERDCLEGHVTRLSVTLANHTLFETPSGWLTVLIGLPIGAIVVTYRKLFNRNNYEGNLTEGARRRASEGSLELAARGHRNGHLMNQYV